MTDLSKRPELQAFLAKGYWPCRCPGYRLHSPSMVSCSVCNATHRSGAPDDDPIDAGEFAPTAKGPTKTEAEYARMFLTNVNPKFEGMTFRLANGHKYTPDYVYFDGDRLVCVEVKGSYRLGSYQRARLAFDQAAVEWPGVRWIWAERQKSGTWKHVHRGAL